MRGPAYHGVHDALLLPATLNCPAGQAIPVLALAPAGQYLPGTGLQGDRHVAALPAPSEALYVPFWHRVHSPAPLTSLKEPCGHCVHPVAPTGLNVPAPHAPVQAEEFRPEVAPNLPAGQGLHPGAAPTSE